MSLFSKVRTAVVLSLIAGLSLSLDADAKRRSAARAKLIAQQTRVAALMSRTLDVQVIEDMKATRESIRAYLKRRLNKADGANSSSALLNLLPTNEYDLHMMQALLNHKLPRARTMTRRRSVVVKLDPSLSNTNVDNMRRNPDKTWRASPGTIMTLTNGYDLVLVWGAGHDGKPVRAGNGRGIRILTIKVETTGTTPSGN